MIRLRVAELLQARGWTAYRLAQEAGFSITLAYRLARPAGAFRRLDQGTLEKLCDTFQCDPGDLIERVPAQATRRKRGK